MYIVLQPSAEKIRDIIMEILWALCATGGAEMRYQSHGPAACLHLLPAQPSRVFLPPLVSKI